MDNIELYYDYCKETCELSKQAQSRRNRFFVWLCILEALSFLFLVKPDKTVEVFSVDHSGVLYQKPQIKV